MAKKTRDFDQYLKERQNKSSSFTLFGQTITLPPTLPYDAVLRFNALQDQKETDEIGKDDMFSIFESVVGKKNIDKLSGNVEFDIDLMVEIIKFALEAYGVGKTEEDTKEEEEPTEGPKK